MEQTAASTTHVHIANSARAPAAVDFELRAADGTSVGTYSADIDPKGILEASLSGTAAASANHGGIPETCRSHRHNAL